MGRTLGTFAHPIYRAKARYWLSEIFAKSGDCSGWALDRSDLFSGLHGRPRFELVDVDGADPGRIEAGIKKNLVEHVACNNRGFAFTKEAYDHQLWKMLLNYEASDGMDCRTHRLHLDNIEMTTFLCTPFSFGAMKRVYSQEDITKMIPDVSQKTWVQQRENNRAFATLDTLAILLSLYRKAQKLEAHLLTISLRAAIKAATDLISLRFSDGEPRLTWEFVVHTRILNWLPDFQPNESAVVSESHSLKESFLEKASFQKRGRPRHDLNKLPLKTEIRLRKHAWIKAAIDALGEDPKSSLSIPHYLRGNAPFGWMLPDLVELKYHSPTSITYKIL